MLSNLRDFMIVLWVVMQAISWGVPQAYGHFNAVADAAYQDTMQVLGIWEE